MKKLWLAAVMVSGTILTGCGGGSSDSSGSYTSTYTSILGNKNEYSCPSATAQKSCDSDLNCVAARCTLTKAVVTPPTSTTTACEATATNVYGKNGTSCKYTATNADAILTCSNGQLMIDGKIGNLTASGSSFGSGFKDSTGMSYSCK